MIQKMKKAHNTPLHTLVLEMHKGLGILGDKEEQMKVKEG